MRKGDIMAQYNRNSQKEYVPPTLKEARLMLTYIDSTDREIWYKMAAALKSEFGEQGKALYFEWSKRADNYKASDCDSQWRGADITKNNIGFLVNRAKENGFVRQNVKPMSSAEIAERNRQNAKRAAKEEQERRKKAVIAAQKANDIWKNKTTPINANHPYLQKKGISDPNVLQSIRYHPRFNSLVVPLKNKGNIVGLQFIKADGDKKFNAGIDKKGSAITIGNRALMPQGFFVAEGFATAASIVQATGKPCVMAIDAGNLPAAMQSLKGFVAKHNAPVVFCADKDENGKGEHSAKIAAEIFGNNAQVIIPDFTADEIQAFQAANGKKPTDFNDLQAIRGIDGVAKALSGSLNNTSSLRDLNNIATENTQDKLLINVYGSPATGKSFTAQNLTTLLQENGIDCVYVSEYATELIHQGRNDELKDQVFVTGEQLRREQAALNHANIVITDSPTALGIIYAPEHQKAALHDIAAQSDKIPHINILLRHNFESLQHFSMTGRIHGKEESLAIQEQLIEMMKGKHPIHFERGIAVEELINQIGVSQQWQRFAELNHIALPRFDINMDGTVMSKVSGSLNAVENNTLTVSQNSETVTMNNEMPRPERAEWEKDFPQAVTNDLKGNLIDLPNYKDAKSGDAIAALKMVQYALTDDTVEQIKRNFAIDKDTLIVPVNALEQAGENHIPQVFARVLADRLGLEVHTDIVQATKVARTRKSADYRLVFQPAFAGEVLPNRNYLIVDDTLIQGGTVASLRGYINNRGGKVIGVAVLSAKEHSLQLAPTPEILHNINHKFGEELNEYWQKEFNYGINQLTNSEAVVLSKGNDFVSIRNRIAQEIISGNGQIYQTGTATAEIIPKELHAVIREMKGNNPNNVLRLETPKDMSNGRVFYETENFVIQQVTDNSRYFQAWNKQDLSVSLQVGDKAKIYVDKNGQVQTKVTATDKDKSLSPDNEKPRPPQGGFVLPAINQSDENRQPENSNSKENSMDEQQQGLQASSFTPDKFQPDTWQPENGLEHKHLDGETAQKVDETITQAVDNTEKDLSGSPEQSAKPQIDKDFAERQAELNRQKAEWQNKLDEMYRQKEAMDNLQVQLTQEQLDEIDKKFEEIYAKQAELDRQTDELQIERRQVLGQADISENLNEENSIYFGESDEIITAEEINKPQAVFATPKEKANAVFEELKTHYQGYGEYNSLDSVMYLPNGKNKEMLHFDPTQERIVLSAVNPQTQGREEVADTHFSNLDPHYIALAVDKDYQQYQQTIAQNQGKFPDNEQKKTIDKAGDSLEETIRTAKSKTAKLTPPEAPPSDLSERYNAVERKFLDTKTNLRLTHRVDYVDSENGKTVLFTDKGSKLTTAKNDPQTAADMVEVAKAKGWTTLKLSGNREFKRQAWLAAESQGIKTKGYSPSPEDKAMLERMREERSLNSVEQAKKQGTQPENTPQAEKQADKTPQKDLSGSPKQETKQDTADKLKGGILLAHGKAPYQFKENGNESYFATIQKPNGEEKTYWGVDIERAIQESGIDNGDRISLKKVGQETVRVEEEVKDEHGKTVLDDDGNPIIEEVMRERMKWQAELYEKAQEVPQAQGKQEDLPQEKLIKHDLMGQPEQNPAELSQKVDEAIFGKRPDEDASVARKGVYTALKVKDAVTIGAGVAAGGAVGGAAAVGLVAVQNYVIDKGLQSVEKTADIDNRKQQATADVKQMLNNPEQPLKMETNSAFRDEVEQLKANVASENSNTLNLVSDMPTDNHLLSGEETAERSFTDIHHNGIAGGETPSEVRHAVDSVQTMANTMRTPSVATPQKGSLKQGKSKNLPYAVQKQQLLAAKETYKTLAKTLNGQDKVRLKMYQDTVAQTIAREKNDKKMLAWQHYYQYVSARIKDGKLNLPKPIPLEQAKQMMKQLTQSQTQQPKPQMQQPTLSKPRKHKM
ncbi:MAG: PriCT-2 domain-containing protein [Neisseriaceae bacterium]|nr:PriCT-2 domain-containing protein [Neisseriaceae bacterium]